MPRGVTVFFLFSIALGFPAPAADGVPDGYPRHVLGGDLLVDLTRGLAPEAIARQNLKPGAPLPWAVVHYRDQVEWLVEHIAEREIYAQHLKYGYISRQLPGHWPATQALALFERDMERERAMSADGPLTARGYALASVAAYARAHHPSLRGWQGAYLDLMRNLDGLAAHPARWRDVVDDFIGVATRGAERRNGFSDSAGRECVERLTSSWLALNAVLPREPEIDGFLTAYGGWSHFLVEAKRTVEAFPVPFAVVRRTLLLRLPAEADEALIEEWLALREALGRALPEYPEFAALSPPEWERLRAAIAAGKGYAVRPPEPERPVGRAVAAPGRP